MLVTTVTNVKNKLSLQKIELAWYYVTPSNSGDVEVPKHKGVRLSSPMSPHAIQKLRIPDADVENGVDAIIIASDVKVELKTNVDDDDDNDDLPDVLASIRSQYNVLIPQNHLVNFISGNFVCKLCKATIRKRELSFDRVGITCNMFWSCSSMICQASAKILAKH
jgi:hypothetical protein